MHRLTFLGLGLFVLFSIATEGSRRSLAADPTPTENVQSQELDFVLHAADVPYAALKYRLLPRAIEMTPGNAAPHYFRAALVWNNDKALQDVDAEPGAGAESKLDQWLKMPLDQLAKNEDAQ